MAVIRFANRVRASCWCSVEFRSRNYV